MEVPILHTEPEKWSNLNSEHKSKGTCSSVLCYAPNRSESTSRRKIIISSRWYSGIMEQMKPLWKSWTTCTDCFTFSLTCKPAENLYAWSGLPVNQASKQVSSCVPCLAQRPKTTSSAIPETFAIMHLIMSWMVLVGQKWSYNIRQSLQSTPKKLKRPSEVIALRLTRSWEWICSFSVRIVPVKCAILLRRSARRCVSKWYKWYRVETSYTYRKKEQTNVTTIWHSENLKKSGIILGSGFAWGQRTRMILSLMSQDLKNDLAAGMEPERETIGHWSFVLT